MFRDAVNPIFLREIRIMVRNNTILACFCVNLAILCYVAFQFLYFESSGAEFFTAILTTEYFFGLLVAPLITASSTVRDGLGDELLWTLPLSRVQRLKGKVQAATVLLCLFYGTSLPFITAAYLMRGVDLWKVLLFPPMLMFSTLVACFWTAAFLYRLESWLQLCCLLTTVVLTFFPGGFLCFVPLLFSWFFFNDLGSTKQTIAYLVSLPITLLPLFFFAFALGNLDDATLRTNLERCLAYVVYAFLFNVLTFATFFFVFTLFSI